MLRDENKNNGGRDEHDERRGEEGRAGRGESEEGVEAMEVVEEISIRASTRRFKGKMVEAARTGWNKVRMLLQGKTIKKDGERLVIEERQMDHGKGGRRDEEFQGEWDEGEIGGPVEIEEEDEDREETLSQMSGESRRTRAGFEFLEEMGEDPELEEKISTERKLKRVEDVTVVRKGLTGAVGWEWREKEGREESGCLNCRDDDGKVTHKSRSGDPVILVIGDEAAPTVVGHNEKGSKESVKKGALGVELGGGDAKKNQ